MVLENSLWRWNILQCSFSHLIAILYQKQYYLHHGYFPVFSTWYQFEFPTLKKHFTFITILGQKYYNVYGNGWTESYYILSTENVTV